LTLSSTFQFDPLPLPLPLPDPLPLPLPASSTTKPSGVDASSPPPLLVSHVCVAVLHSSGDVQSLVT
jgi:hypothetical protein